MSLRATSDAVSPDSPADLIDLSGYIDMILRRRWIAATIALITTVSVAFYAFSLRPVFRSGALLVIEKERGAKSSSNSTLTESTNEDYYQTQFLIMKSYSLLETVHRKLGLSEDPEFGGANGVKKLEAAVAIQPVARSRLVYIYVDSFSPEQARRIANALAEEFIAQNLDSQLFISRDILNALQAREDNPETRLLYESLPAVIGNSVINDLKMEASKLEVKFGETSQRYTAKHPNLVTMHATQRALRARIEEETLRVVRSLKTELSGRLLGNNVRVIDPARLPTFPYKPNKRNFLFIGLLLGLGLGVLAASVVDLLDQSIHGHDDVERKLRLPLLAIIPHAPDESLKKPYAALLGDAPSFTSETFRNLRTMVTFADVASRHSQFMVTSTQQEEGKTYVSTNLAVVFAQLGAKVLLIDGDLRRPKVHRNFRVSNERGLSNFLAGGESVDELQPLLCNTEFPGLKILPCGPRPPNPSELLNTPRVAALLSWAGENFDHVLVDCTPLFPISDTILWGNHIRAAIFVVRYGKTRVPAIQSATNRLAVCGVKTLGVVVNGAVSGGLTYSYYGRYYQQYYHSYQEAGAAKSA